MISNGWKTIPQPGRVLLGGSGQSGAQRIDVCPSPVGRLIRIDCRGGIAKSEKNVVEFIFYQTVAHIRRIGKGENLLDRATEAHFLAQPSPGRVGRNFVGSWVGAAGSGPQAGAMVFMRGPAEIP
jgi:hypothetical protein